MAASLCHRAMATAVISRCSIFLQGGSGSYTCIRHAKKIVAAKMTAQPVKKEILPVETDANIIVNYVCGANYIEGEEMIKIKADSEYPEWLWELNTGRPPSLDELDPNDITYWRRLRRMALRRNLDLMKVKKF